MAGDRGREPERRIYPLDVKPLHSTTEDPYHNGDQAGTPKNTEYQKHVTAGARGGGGSNYTDSYTGTGRCP